MMPILYTVIYSLCCLLFGVIFFRTLFRQSEIWHRLSAATMCAAAFILGQGLLANVWLALGLLTIFNKTLIWSVLILMAIGCSFLIVDLPSSLWREIRGCWDDIRKLQGVWYPLLMLVGILVIAFGIKSLTNMILWEDGEAFYFVLPKIMASSERLIAQRNYASFTQIGLSGDMHYAALMSISG